MKVKVSFKLEFLGPIRDGRKRMTSRREPLGNIGDEFEAFGQLFQITEIFQSKLEDVANQYYTLEGVETPEHFKSVWNKIHPIRGFVPEQLVWVHRFIRIGGE